MSDPESFLERWSRRKSEAPRDPESEPERKDAAAPPPNSIAEEQGAKPDEPFDIAQLPSIESIGADTDVSAFLRPGVPPELTRAALRRAWSSDPAIRDFMGPVENGWDFTDPDAMPGFGRIAANEVAQLLSQAMGLVEPEAPAAGPSAPESAENATRPDAQVSDARPPEAPATTAEAPATEETSENVQRNKSDIASQHKDQT